MLFVVTLFMPGLRNVSSIELTDHLNVPGCLLSDAPEGLLYQKVSVLANQLLFTTSKLICTIQWAYIWY